MAIDEEKPISKKLVAFVLVLGLFDTALGLTVPLLTVNLINGFSVEDFDWSTLMLVVFALILQAIFSGLTFFLCENLANELLRTCENFYGVMC